MAKALPWMAKGIYAPPYMAKSLLPGCYAGRQLSDGRWEIVAQDDDPLRPSWRRVTVLRSDRDDETRHQPQGSIISRRSPIEQPVKFELVVNLKTVRNIALPISRDFLLRADDLIE